MSSAAVVIGALRVQTLKQQILKLIELANSTDPDEVAHSTLISVLLLDSTFWLPLCVYYTCLSILFPELRQ